MPLDDFVKFNLLHCVHLFDFISSARTVAFLDPWIS